MWGCGRVREGAELWVQTLVPEGAGGSPSWTPLTGCSARTSRGDVSWAGAVAGPLLGLLRHPVPIGSQIQVASEPRPSLTLYCLLQVTATL